MTTITACVCTYHGTSSFDGVECDNNTNFYRTDSGLGVVMRQIQLPINTNRVAWHVNNNATLLISDSCISAKGPDGQIYYYHDKGGIYDPHYVALTLIQIGAVASKYADMSDKTVGGPQYFSLPVTTIEPEYSIQGVEPIHDPRFGVINLTPPMYIGSNKHFTVRLTTELDETRAELTKARQECDKYHGIVEKLTALLSSITGTVVAARADSK